MLKRYDTDFTELKKQEGKENLNFSHFVWWNLFVQRVFNMDGKRENFTSCGILSFNLCTVGLHSEKRNSESSLFSTTIVRLERNMWLTMRFYRDFPKEKAAYAHVKKSTWFPPVRNFPIQRRSDAVEFKYRFLSACTKFSFVCKSNL